MIITKSANQIKGYIEYRYDFNPANRMIHEITHEDEEMMYEIDTFSSLEELLEKLKPEVLEEIRKHYEADKVWVSCISLKAVSENGETTAEITLFENKKGRGYVATKIHNEDITNRALLNIKKIKEIVDNTLEQFPIKY